MPVDLSYPSKPKRTTPELLQSTPHYLSPSDNRALVEESGIAPEIVAERGYYTARSRSEVPETFAGYQRRLGLVIPMFSPDGITRGWQLRPDKPRKKGPKYETPPGVSPVVDVHPRMFEEARHGDGPLLITEGAKTGDAATSRGMCTVVLAGVWTWCVPNVKPYRLKPCFDHIRLEEREVLVAFDSDCMSKAGVQEALAALVAALKDRGAAVKAIYLPNAADGSKQGVDDFLVAGGSVGKLKLLARRFEPKDLTLVRLSRDKRLRERVSELWARWREMPVKTMAEVSRRSVVRVLIRQAGKSGKLVADGVRVKLSSRTGAERAGLGQKTWVRAVAALEDEEMLRREKSRRKEEAASYVLKTKRAPMTHHGGKAKKESFVVKGEYREPSSSTESLRPPDPRESLERASDEVPELRWPRVIVSWTMDGSGYRVCEVSPLERLGKRRGALIEFLIESGQCAAVATLMERFGGKRTRVRDFKRRMLEPLEDAEVIIVEGNAVRLAVDWREALQNRRELGEEQEAAESQKKRHELEREAFHNRKKSKLDQHPANVGADGYVEELEPAKLKDLDLEDLGVEDLTDDFEDLEDEIDVLVGMGTHPPHNTSENADALLGGGGSGVGGSGRTRSDLARAIRGYLNRNPEASCQPPGWIGTTLWAYDLYPDKPTPDEVRIAMEELGREARIRNLKRAGRRVA